MAEQMKLLTLTIITQSRKFEVSDLSEALVEKIQAGILAVITGKESVLAWSFPDGSKLLLPRELALQTVFGFKPQT